MNEVYKIFNYEIDFNSSLLSKEYWNELFTKTYNEYILQGKCGIPIEFITEDEYNKGIPIKIEPVDLLRVIGYYDVGTHQVTLIPHSVLARTVISTMEHNVECKLTPVYVVNHHVVSNIKLYFYFKL